MNAAPSSLSQQAREHDRLFSESFLAVQQARSRHVKVRPHRAITPLKVTPWLLAQAIVLPLVLCALLWWARPVVLDAWRQYILWWSTGLGLPFGWGVDGSGRSTLALPTGVAGSLLPATTTLLVTAAAVLAALALSLRMRNGSLPLKYPLRIVCMVQAVALACFWLAPQAFPYSLARHSEELMTIGYVVVLATPIMLGIGYYILNQRLWTKLAHTAVILGFFGVLVPHQVLAQAFILQHLSILFMPVLYICFGAVFDALVFVALYSWTVSDTSVEATF